MFGNRIRATVLGSLLAAAAMVGLVAAGPASAAPARPVASTGSVSCTATLTVVAQWQTGFQAVLTVTNTGTATINGWYAFLVFPDGRQRFVTSNLFDGTLAPGASVQVGVLLDGSPTPPPTIRCIARA